MQDVCRPVSSSVFLRQQHQHFFQGELYEVKLSFNRIEILRTEIRNYECGRYRQS